MHANNPDHLPACHQIHVIGLWIAQKLSHNRYKTSRSAKPLSLPSRRPKTRLHERCSFAWEAFLEHSQSHPISVPPSTKITPDEHVQSDW